MALKTFGWAFALVGLAARSEASAGEPDDSECRGVTATRGSTGHVEISDLFIGATFYADDLILRETAHPECVAHIESPAESFAAAGALSVSSGRVGTPGGPAAPFVILPDAATQEYFEFPDPPLFDLADGTRVAANLTGAPGFPPIRATTLRSSAFEIINVTAPQLPESGVLAISSAAPLELQWEVPTAPPHVGRHQPSVSVRLLVLGPEHWGQLYCSWPVSSGHGTVPALLASALREQLGGSGALDGVLDVYSGELREIATARSSYVLFVTTDLATTLPRSTPVTFE